MAIWLDDQEVAALPTSGAAFTAVKKAAASSWPAAKVSDQDSKHDTLTLAGALVAVRTGDSGLEEKTRRAVMAAVGTEAGGRTLAAGRNLVPYVIAADIVGLTGADEQKFRGWLTVVRTANLSGKTLISTHEERPNNWGTHAGASRIAASLYLGDTADVAKAAKVFKGWLGDRSAYAGFDYGDLSWQADQTKPVGVNPAGAKIQGHNVDGVLPDDQRRGGGFKWPPPKENYVWEALQGATVQAQLLHRAGYPAWEWSDRALLRAVKWLHDVCGFPADGDDQWQPWLVNAAYGTAFKAVSPAGVGKNMGWTDWTHATAAAPPPPPPTDCSAQEAAVAAAEAELNAAQARLTAAEAALADCRG